MEAIQTLLIGLVVGLFLLFIGMNWLVGCESWIQPECVTPKEFFRLVIGK